MSVQLNRHFLFGLSLVLLLSSGAILLANHPWIKALQLNPLIIGVLIGMVYSIFLGRFQPTEWDGGIFFSGKKILRLAIILYGFRITFQEIFAVGMEGLLASTLMLLSTFFMGSFAGQKLFKLDRDTSMLIASGSAVCGAAAVLATESVLRASPHKAIIAIATVVCFGTISMFLYPALYQADIFQLSPSHYGIYVGSAVHEVAQVVVAGNAIEGAGEAAVIVKMTRVMMLVPLLIFLNFRYKPLTHEHDTLAKPSILKAMPWFAILFVCVAGFNSLHLLTTSVVDGIITLDTFLLTMAMTALGMKISIEDFKLAGIKPLLLAVVIFAWLLIGGYWVTKWIVHLLAL